MKHPVMGFNGEEAEVHVDEQTPMSKILRSYFMS
jgi:aerobic-type carbon monoxide dehydrogenase small subunit (CoxS/CutS family)